MSQPDGDEWRALRERRKPTDEEWAVAKEASRAGCHGGRGAESSPVGFFVYLGSPAIGLVEISRVKEPGQPVGLQDYPPVGQEITAVVLGAADLQRKAHLNTRPSELAGS